MLSFTEVGKHANKTLLCYDNIKTCYSETSPYAMKCMLCHHLHSALNTHIRDDTIKVSGPAASANHSDIHNQAFWLIKIVGIEINVRPRERAASFLTKIYCFRHIFPQSIPKQILLSITSAVEKKTPAIILAIQVMNTD